MATIPFVPKVAGRHPSVRRAFTFQQLVCNDAAEPPLTSIAFVKPFIALQRWVLGQRANRLGVREARLQFASGITPNQQGDEGADVGVLEPG